MLNIPAILGDQSDNVSARRISYIPCCAISTRTNYVCPCHRNHFIYAHDSSWYYRRYTGDHAA
ncbi:MAG: hypothetical protein IT420_01055 [Candidatus Brocadia sp.]|nr:hypothetical protein [Candidatus Brocadia sp.]MDG5998129.1 hypothetical protein [Candidatus Brocadia sp.]